MPHYFRRILFYTFVILFFVSAALVLFYQSGYRYHFAKKKIEMTGQLVIPVEPRDATLIFNGQALDTKAPGVRIGTQHEIRLERILSGTYDLALQKEGYHEWTTRVTIEPGRTTLVPKVTLLRALQPRQLIQGDVRGIASSLDREIIYWTDRELLLKKSNTQESIRLAGFSQSIDAVLTSQSEEYFFVRAGREHAIVSREGKMQSILGIFQVKKFVWGPRDTLYAFDDSRVYKVEATGLHAFAFKSPESLIDILSRDNELYLLTHSEIWRMEDEKMLKEYTRIPNATEFGKHSKEAPIVVRSSSGNILIRDSGGSIQQLALPKDSALRTLSNNRFLVWDNFEIWIYTLEGSTYRREFITRQSEAIRDVVAIPETSYLLIMTDTATRAIDIQTRGGVQHFFDIAHYDVPITIFPDMDANRLLMISHQSDTRGVLEVQLTEM